MKSQWRRPARLVFAYSLSIAAVASICWYVGINGKSLWQGLRSIPPLCVMLAIGCFACHLALNAWGFALAGSALDCSVSKRKLWAAWTATLAAKYVPGGIWHVVGRGITLARLGVSARQTIAVGIFEQVLSLLLCLGITLCLHGWIHAQWWLALLAPGLPLLWIWASGKLARVFDVPVMNHRSLVPAAATYAVAMFPYGLGYLLLAAPIHPLLFLQALFAGTVAGVLAVPVPGGLGVREAVTAYLEGSTASARTIAGLLAARLLLLVVEILASIAGQSFAALRRSSA